MGVHLVVVGFVTDWAGVEDRKDRHTDMQAQRQDRVIQQYEYVVCDRRAGRCFFNPLVEHV